MSYIVVYQREDGSSGVEECADLDLAVVAAERLRNVDAVERPRIFKTAEITYDFKPYYRVEVTNENAAPDVGVAEPSPAGDFATVMSGPPADPTEVFTPAPPAVPEPASADTSSEKTPAAEEIPAVSDSEASEPASVKKGLFSSDNIPEPPQEFPAVAPVADEVDDTDDIVPPRRGLFGR